MNILKTEPAVVTGFVIGVINFLASYGILQGGTQQSLVAIVTALVPFVLSFFIRSQVTPTAKLGTTV